MRLILAIKDAFELMWVLLVAGLLIIVGVTLPIIAWTAFFVAPMAGVLLILAAFGLVEWPG